MRILRKPQTNAVIISVVSIFYALVFIISSGHLEFERILNHADTLNSTFWNGWSAFLKQGNMKYIGYAYIALALAIIVISFVRKKDYDEYQTGIFEKGIIVMGAAMVVLFPIALVLVMSDPSYCIETMMFLVVAHWSIVLIADLIYVIKWVRS
ncbi:MAG: hypothetical protein IJE60_02185 [Tyzzerella sp.]|nr:hypothetical protein [Tyzzerella sp.]